MKKNESFEHNVAKTFQELVDLLLSKHKDYGPKNLTGGMRRTINNPFIKKVRDYMLVVSHRFSDFRPTQTPQSKLTEDSII